MSPRVTVIHRVNRILQSVGTLLPFALFTGCAMGNLTLSGPDNSPVAVAVNISGTVHGGQQPITGSALQLYTVGTSGYGSLATALIISGGVSSVTITNGGAGYTSAPLVTFTGGGGSGATATAALGSGANAGQVVSLVLTNHGSGYTSAPTISFTGGGTPTIAATATAQTVPSTGIVSDANGNFSITGDYTCPFPSSSMVYITATNGNPGLSGTNVSNGAIRLIAPLGPCSGLSNATTVFLNEVTTAATAFAMGQYFTTQFGGASIDSFGAPNTTQAQAGIANAYATVGNLVNIATGNAITSASFTSTTGTVTITPESAKLYTIANILASCVNTSSAASSSCATLFADVVPTGATKPTDVLQAAVYMSLNPISNNANGSSANLTALYGLISSTPPYVSGSQPTDWTLGITYASSSTQVASSLTEGVMSYPERLAIDASGNVWMTNNITPSTTATTVAGLTEMTSTGTLVQQVLTDGSLVGPRAPTFDSNGNIWIANFGSATASNTVGYGKTVVEYTTGGSKKTFNVAGGPNWLAGDGQGNMYAGEVSVNVTNTATPAGNGTAGADLEVISGTAASGSTGTVLTNASNGYSMTQYGTIGIDSNYNVWDATGGTTVLAFQPPYTAAGLSFTATDPEPLAIDSTNDVFVANYVVTTPTPGAPGQVDKLTLSSGSIMNAMGAPFIGGGLAQAELAAIDGAGNFWITNYPSSSTGFISEFSNAGIPLSPTTGGFAHTFHGAFGIAVDPSGNVWVGNNTPYTEAAIAPAGTNGGAAAGGFLTEIVGAAVPVVTPIAAGMPSSAGGTSTMGTRP